MVQFESSSKHSHTRLAAQINNWSKHVPLHGCFHEPALPRRGSRITDQRAFAARSGTYSERQAVSLWKESSRAGEVKPQPASSEVGLSASAIVLSWSSRRYWRYECDC